GLLRDTALCRQPATRHHGNLQHPSRSNPCGYCATARSILPIKIVPMNKACNPERFSIVSRKSRAGRLPIDLGPVHKPVCNFEQTRAEALGQTYPNIVGDCASNITFGFLCP